MARASLVPLALLSPLRHRSFALLWGGQACSHLGDSVSAVALPWLVYDLTDSPVAMATVLVLFSVATMLLLPVGGVLADRLARRRLMIFMDAVRGVAMATIAGLVAAGGIEIWHVQALAVVVGGAAGVFLPTQTAILPDVVANEDLPAANALASSSRSLATVVGPLLGAALIAAGGLSLAFAFDAATFLVSGLCLLALRLSRRAATAPPATSPMSDLATGFRAVAVSSWLRAGIVLFGLAAAFTYGARFVVLPQLVRLELGGGVEVLGALQSAVALGMVAGTLAIGQWGKGFPRGAEFYGALALSGLALAGLGLAPNLPAALTLAAGLGASAGAANVIWTASQQALVPAALLGRVSSIDLLVTAGLMPLGVGGAGFFAKTAGPAPVFLLGGLATAALALLGLLWPTARRFGDSRGSSPRAPMPHLAVWQRALVAKRGAAAATLADRVQARYDEMSARQERPASRAVRSFLARNVLPYLALYQTLREEGADQAAALAEVEGLLGLGFARPPRLAMSMFGQLPGGVAFALFRRLLLLDTRRRFPSPWWEMEVVENSDLCLAINGRGCITLDVCTAAGAPELATVYCRLDDRLAEALLPPTIVWARTTTLARGGDRCDFCWRRAT